MRKQLPARPHLDHLRSQAKSLLHALRQGDVQAARTFIDHLPEAAALTEAEVLARGYRLADAQNAIARKSGFAAWPGLARHVERLRSLEGTWAFRSLEIDGQAVPGSMLATSHLLIDGDRFRMESPEAVYDGIFTIDVDQTPHLIDIDFVEGPEAGNRCEGLFELDGDRVRFCLGLAGSTRPASFATSPGSGHALEDLERVIHGRPAGVDGGTPVELPPPPAKSPDVDFPDTLTPTLEQLQGEWMPLELINDGQPLQRTYLPFGTRTNTGVETKVVFGGQTMVQARMRVNEDSSPLEIDYLNLLGRAEGSLSRGIFRWEDGQAVFCMGAAGGPRPTDFESPAGAKQVLSRWKRRLF